MRERREQSERVEQVFDLGVRNSLIRHENVNPMFRILLVFPFSFEDEFLENVVIASDNAVESGQGNRGIENLHPRPKSKISK